MAVAAVNDLYRNTTLGNLLKEALDELVLRSQLNPAMATKVFVQFDRAMAHALANRAKTRLTFRAEKLLSYRYFDNVWQIHLKNVEFREFYQLAKLEDVKLVGCNSPKCEITDKTRH